MGLGIRTYFLHQYESLTGKHAPMFEGHYHEWRARRILAILDHYGHWFFFQKSIIELGAGYGAIGSFFGTIGGKVTCVEGRAKNARKIGKRHPHVAAMHHDLTEGWPKDCERFDVVIHMGVLYHLQNAEQNLRDACRRCDHMILETEISDSSDPNFILSVTERAYVDDQAVDGRGTRPSQFWVERILAEEGFEFEMIPDGRCNADCHVYDWPLKNTGGWTPGYRRMWFCKRTGVK